MFQFAALHHSYALSALTTLQSLYEAAVRYVTLRMPALNILMAIDGMMAIDGH